MSNDLIRASEILPEPVQPTALEALTRSEIDTQIATARRFPRSLARFRQEALAMACLDIHTAQSCTYSLKREGKVIEGPTIRLAEMVAVAWGNLRYAGRIIGEDGPFIVAQGVAHDLEKNMCASVEVRRRITRKDGSRYSEDMVAVTANAAIAIAVRNAIYKVVPRAFVDHVHTAAKAMAAGDARTVAERRAAAWDYFTRTLRVKPERLMAYLSTEDHPVRGVEDVGLPELELLNGLRVALKEGETTLEDAFPSPADQLRELSARSIAPPPPPEAQPPANGVHEPRRPDPPQAAPEEDGISGEVAEEAELKAELVRAHRGNAGDLVPRWKALPQPAQNRLRPEFNAAMKRPVPEGWPG